MADGRRLAQAGHAPLPARGRPRDPALETRVLDAALDLLGRNGFEGMTMEAVAQAADVTKPTLYRRWRSKEDLATAAVATLATRDHVPRSEDPWQDLIAEVSLFRVAVERPNGMAFIGTLLAEESRTPELLRMFRERVIAQRRSRVMDVIRRLQVAGEIDGALDAQFPANMLLGYFYSTYLAGTAMSDDWPEACVAILRAGLRTRPSPIERPPRARARNKRA